MAFDWELACFLADAGLTLIFFRLQKMISTAARHIENAAEISVDENLSQMLDSAPGGNVAYVAVRGIIKPVGSPLFSHYHSEEKGVIQKLRLVEHKARRSQGFWVNTERVLRDATNYTPFSLSSTCPNDETNVYVCNPLGAMSFNDNFKITHDKYECVKSSMLDRTIDRLAGDVTKGFQETEEMLSVDESLLGIGTLVKSAGKIRLKDPDCFEYAYILTRLEKEDVVKIIRGRARRAEIAMYVFLFIGVGIVSYWSFKKFKFWHAEYKKRQIEKRIIENRERRSNNNQETDNSDNNCVACLSNPREIVILECGHVCLCYDCYGSLSDTLCPICRGSISRILPVYMS